MEIAAALGWRDVLTQLWTIDAAKRSGETQKAVERADSLFQQHFFQPALLALLQDPINPELTSGFVADLAKNPPWRTDLLRSGADLPQPSLDRFEQLLVQLGNTNAPPTTHEAGSLVDRLAQTGRIDDARRIWSAMHGSALVLNGDFEAVETAADSYVPSGWNISDEDAAAIDIGKPEAGDNSRALRLYGTRDPGGIISQRLMLTPGAYVLAFRAYENPPSGSLVRWELRCSTSGTATSADANLSSAAWQQFRLDLTVPNQNCPVQRLSLKRPGDIHAHELWIDDVALKLATR
jgi:hypothetical protein